MNYNTDDFSSYTMPPTFVGMQAIPQWNYLVYDNSINKSTYNGNLYTYYYIGPMYQISRMKLGHITPYDSYYYEIYLRDVNTGIIKGECYVSEDPYNPWSSDALYIDDHHDVYVNTIYLDYGGQYRLDVDSYYGTGGTDFSNDFDYYLFLPQNANVSGDYILFFGSGDFDNRDASMQTVGAIQDSTQTTIDYISDYSGASGELAAVFDDGNVLSGDVIAGVKMPHIARGDDLTIYNLVNAFCETLSQSGDPYIDVSLHGESPVRLYASDFRTPNGLLKTFVSSFLVFGTLYMLLLQIRGFVESLSVGDFKTSMNIIDADLHDMYYM